MQAILVCVNVYFLIIDMDCTDPANVGRKEVIMLLACVAQGDRRGGAGGGGGGGGGCKGGWG